MLAARLAAAAERRGRRIAVIEVGLEPGAPPGRAWRSTASSSAGGAAPGRRSPPPRPDATPRCSCFRAPSDSALAIAWARLADSCLVVVDGLRPERDPVLRLVARLREAGAVPGGVVAVTA